jgi:hypothetical protein
MTETVLLFIYEFFEFFEFLFVYGYQECLRLYLHHYAYESIWFDWIEEKTGKGETFCLIDGIDARIYSFPVFEPGDVGNSRGDHGETVFAILVGRVFARVKNMSTIDPISIPSQCE